MDMYYGHFWGMHWVWWLIWVPILIWFISSRSVNSSRNNAEEAKSILKNRLAKGEINEEEYERKLKLLEKDEQ